MQQQNNNNVLFEQNKNVFFCDNKRQGKTVENNQNVKQTYQPKRCGFKKEIFMVQKCLEIFRIWIYLGRYDDISV